MEGIRRMGEFLSAELVGIMVVDVAEPFPVVSIRSGILTAALDLSGFIQLLCDLSAGTGISAAAFDKEAVLPPAICIQDTAHSTSVLSSKNNRADILFRCNTFSGTSPIRDRQFPGNMKFCSVLC